MIFTCVTFVFFTILVAVISYVKTKGDDQTTADGYFLAGRGLPVIEEKSNRSGIPLECRCEILGTYITGIISICRRSKE